MHYISDIPRPVSIQVKLIDTFVKKLPNCPVDCSCSTKVCKDVIEKAGRGNVALFAEKHEMLSAICEMKFAKRVIRFCRHKQNRKPN